jgi:hypothetical protein
VPALYTSPAPGGATISSEREEVDRRTLRGPPQSSKTFSLRMAIGRDVPVSGANMPQGAALSV